MWKFKLVFTHSLAISTSSVRRDSARYRSWVLGVCTGPSRGTLTVLPSFLIRGAGENTGVLNCNRGGLDAPSGAGNKIRYFEQPQKTKKRINIDNTGISECPIHVSGQRQHMINKLQRKSGFLTTVSFRFVRNVRRIVRWK